MAEHLTFNQGVTGSNPVGPTFMEIFMSDNILYLIANWKMYGCLEDFLEFNAALPLLQNPLLKPVLCLPFTLLWHAQAHLQPEYKLGAQDCSASAHGASLTGQISARMLQDAGCQYALIGHAERRAFESPLHILQKKQQLEEHGITPIFCIGEKNKDLVFEELEEQLLGIEREEPTFLLAYEPVFAIGGKEAADMHHLKKVFMFLRERFQKTPLLYGGSVSIDNMSALFELNINGFLVGRASRQSEDWIHLLNKAHVLLQKSDRFHA